MEHSWVQISLGNLRENYRRLLKLFPHQQLWPVVKSDAYGHGALSCCMALKEEGCNTLAVFSVDEAAQLRECGIDCRLMLLGGALPEDFDTLLQLDNVVVALWDLALARELSKFAAARQRVIDCHLKIDTGMSRLGFYPQQLPAAIDFLKEAPGLRLCGAFSHLSYAASKEQNERQALRFAQALTLLPPSCKEIHLSATPGMMAGVGMDYPIVRPGVALYGYGTELCLPGMSFLPVMSFKSRVISIKDVPPGELVSYGGCFCVEEGLYRRIGVVPVGYADGYPRLLGNCAEVLVCGKRAPVRGRICMGMMMVDLTEIPQAAPGAEVVLLGEQGDDSIDAVELAQLIHTIPYEILCSLGKHPHRRFV